MPSFDLRDFAARQYWSSGGGTSNVRASGTTAEITSTSSATMELLGSVDNIRASGSMTTEHTNHSVNTSIYAEGRSTTATSSVSCTGAYQINGIAVYESIVGDALNVSAIHAETQGGSSLNCSLSSLDVDENGHVTFSFTVTGSIPAYTVIEVSATLTGSVRSQWYSGAGTGSTTWDASNTSYDTYNLYTYNWTGLTGSYTDTSSSGEFAVDIRPGNTTVSGSTCTTQLYLTFYLKNRTTPSSIGYALDRTGTLTTTSYSATGRIYAPNYISISNEYPDGLQVDATQNGNYLEYTVTAPRTSGAGSYYFTVSYTVPPSSGYYYYWKIRFNGNTLGSIGSSTARYIEYNGERLDAYDYYFG